MNILLSCHSFGKLRVTCPFFLSEALNNYDRGGLRRPRAFTLVEVIVSTLILGILFSGMLLAFHRTQEGTYQYALHERAAAVGQRRIELIMATIQEPNGLFLQGQDEIDPLFFWTLNLERVLIDENSLVKKNENTIIKASVSVEAGLGGYPRPLIELVRYFDYLNPLPGNEVAVPLPLAPNARWLERLREELGREPTLEEIILELVKMGELTPEMAQDLGVSVDIGAIKEIIK